MAQAETARSGGTIFGPAGDGLYWQHRSDRPLHHPDDCQGACCWRKVPRAAMSTDGEGTNDGR